jgi:hypothetical protein
MNSAQLTSLEAFEASDLGVGKIGELRGYERDLAMVLSEQGPAGRQRPHSRPSGAGRHRGRCRGRSLTCHLPPDAAGGPSQPSEVPWSSPTASTVGATGARTAATTETTDATTDATTAETASSTNLERLTARVAPRIEGEAGYEVRCRTA